MKRTLPLILLLSICLFFISCQNPASPAAPDSEQTSYEVSFKNSSQYDVNVYIGISPYYDTTPAFTVNYGSTKKYNMPLSQDSIGTAVYFEYLIKIGNAKFPFWDINTKECSCTVVVTKDNNNSVTISPITSCTTDSAFLLIENNTAAPVQLLNGEIYVAQADTKNMYTIEANGGFGVYELSKSTDVKVHISLDNYNYVKLVSSSTYYNLPQNLPKIEKGYVYTISLNNIATGGAVKTETTLKAITPFNIDTQRQIWKKENSDFICSETNKPIIRNSANKNGYYIMGSLKEDSNAIGITKLDIYGVETKKYTMKISASDLEDVQILDFAVRSDESVVFLVKENFKHDEIKHYLYVYDFANKSVIYSFLFENTTNPLYVCWDYSNLKNILYLQDDNTVAIAGSINECNNQAEGSEFDKYYYFFGLADIQNQLLKSFVSTEYDDYYTEETIRTFNSAFFDGTYYYVCGYENFDPKYEKTGHSGVIYRFDSDLKNECIYKLQNSLLFAVNGTSTDYYVCGEYLDTGKTLKGLFLSSDMIAKNAKPVLFTTILPQCWFEELCLYDNKVVLCGTASSSFSGTNAGDTTTPVVTAYTFDGTELWENTFDSLYKKAINIVPTAIGTYLVQLQAENSIVFLASDLLGH